MRPVVVPFRHRASQVAPLRETQMIDDTMTHGRPPHTPKRLDKPDESTARNRRDAIYDARMTAADAERLDEPDELTARNRRGPFMTPGRPPQTPKRPFMNSLKPV